MRVLCVGRHAYLSEHLSRYFGELGAQCDVAVGAGAVPALAARFEPHLVVSDSELLTPSLLEAWSREATLCDIPVLAVSLTQRPEDTAQAGVVYLPALDREQGLALLAGAYLPRGVESPAAWTVPQAPPSAIVQ